MQVDKRRRQGSFYIEILLVFKSPVENTAKSLVGEVEYRG